MTPTDQRPKSAKSSYLRASSLGNRPPIFSARLLNNITSPYGLATISYAFFLFACLIPPSVYSHYMMEPDLMFLDPTTILFYTLCIASFFAGAWLVSWLFPSSFVDRKFQTMISPTVFLLLPLTAGIVASIASLFILLRDHPDIIILLMSQKGADVKEVVALEIASNINLAPLMLSGIIWWAFWRSSDFRLKGWRNWLVNSVLLIAILSVIATATIIVSRDILMMVTCGLAVSYMVRRNADRRVSFKFVVRGGAAVAVSVALLFFAFSFLRGVGNWDDQVNALFGYTVASYNRLAAVVNGSLRYPFAGRGLYLSSFVTFNHTWNRVVPLGRVMDWPSQLDDWGAQFGAVTRAGLDGSLIWSGTFGYIFSDLGWFSFPFVFGYGVLYGVAWNWIKRGKVLGIVLYPCLGFCALFWVGANILLDSQRAVVFVAAIVLAGYELIFAKRTGANCRA